MEIFYKNDDLIIQNNDKNSVIFDIKNNTVKIDDFTVDYPWEYEKSGILLEVKEYKKELFYKFFTDSKHCAIVYVDDFEINEDILSFFWDLDVLILIWTKDAVKIYKTIEAKLVIPYWEGKDVFLNTLWQHPEEVINYKVKS